MKKIPFKWLSTFLLYFLSLISQEDSTYNWDGDTLKTFISILQKYTPQVLDTPSAAIEHPSFLTLPPVNVKVEEPQPSVIPLLKTSFKDTIYPRNRLKLPLYPFASSYISLSAGIYNSLRSETFINISNKLTINEKHISSLNPYPHRTPYHFFEISTQIPQKYFNAIVFWDLSYGFKNFAFYGIKNIPQENENILSIPSANYHFPELKASLIPIQIKEKWFIGSKMHMGYFIFSPKIKEIYFNPQVNASYALSSEETINAMLNLLLLNNIFSLKISPYIAAKTNFAFLEMGANVIYWENKQNSTNAFSLFPNIKITKTIIPQIISTTLRISGDINQLSRKDIIENLLYANFENIPPYSKLTWKINPAISYRIKFIEGEFLYSLEKWNSFLIPIPNITHPYLFDWQSIPIIFSRIGNVILLNPFSQIKANIGVEFVFVHSINYPNKIPYNNYPYLLPPFHVWGEFEQKFPKNIFASLSFDITGPRSYIDINCNVQKLKPLWSNTLKIGYSFNSGNQVFLSIESNLPGNNFIYPYYQSTPLMVWWGGKINITKTNNNTLLH